MAAIDAYRCMRLGIAALVAFGSAPASAQQEFCQSLQRVIADAPNKFHGLKTGTYHKALEQWDASVVLPGLATCRIDVELDNYLCTTDNLTPVQASQEHARFVGKVKECLPDLASSTRTKDEPDHMRTTVEWTLAGGHLLQVSRRNARPPGRADKVFIYVLAN
jgi:hypothetical protein